MILGALAALVLVAPLFALLVRAPWTRWLSLVAEPTAREALWLSVSSAGVATGIAVLFGVPLAATLATGFRGATAVRLAVVVPMLLPPVVVGAALLALLGRRGLLGRHLDAVFGWVPTYSFTGVVIAQVVVAMPFLVVAVESAFRSRDVGVEEAVRVHGGRPGFLFRRVTLPAVAPAIGAGAAMCFARALGEFGATITFAGNVAGKTQTMPLAIYLALQRDDETAVALSVALIAASLAVLVAFRGRWIPGVVAAVTR